VAENYSELRLSDRRKDMDPKLTNLEQMLDRISNAAEGKERVTLKTVIDATGSRSFGPLLLLAGLIILAPIIGDIPGMPTIMGLLVFLTAGQLLIRRERFWLPSWLLKRPAGRDKLLYSLKRLRPVSRFVDRWLRRRSLRKPRNVCIAIPDKRNSTVPRPVKYLFAPILFFLKSLYKKSIKVCRDL